MYSNKKNEKEIEGFHKSDNEFVIFNDYGIIYVFFVNSL